MKARKSIRPLLMAAALLSVGILGAAPQDPVVRVGSASISKGTTTVINQSTSSLAIDWQSFDLAAGESVRFNQPSSSSVALNRVINGSPTSIFGRIDANGRVILVNSAGILFGAGAQVNTGAFVASSLELDESTLGSDRLRFFGAGGSVENAGILNGQEFVAVVAPTIVNSGSVRGSSVALAAGAEVIISTAGGLFDVQVPSAAVKAAIENKGGIIASQGNAYLTARGVSAAASSLSNPGKVEATGLVERDGRIYLESEGALTTVGTVKATRAADGGDIEIKGGFVALGGTISADGAKGGTVKVESKGMLSLAENVSAKGLVTTGGSITYRSAGQTIENSTGFSDVSGRTEGGRVSLDAEQGVMSSGRYLAVGATGKGGMIDLTGYGVRLLSATLDASGKTQGGLIRVGGAFQGGKNLGIRGDNGDLLQAYVGRWSGPADISNAQRTLVNDSSVLKVSATSGEGGTAIVWSDIQTTMAGKILAGGVRGGVTEISSADELRKAAVDQVVGARHILLDPKNIVIGTAEQIGSWTYSAIIGAGYSGSAINLNVAKEFGRSVALDPNGSRLAVGAPGDEGFGNQAPDTGAVYLFSFTSTSFDGGALQSIVGRGYAGGKNIDVTTLEQFDGFGQSVSLSTGGSRLAVGAPGDDGFGNQSPDAGAAYLFNFTSASFDGGLLQCFVGKGYAGWKDITVTTLEQFDGFGQSVALDSNGSRLAVGAPGDDGFGNLAAGAGAAYLFSFTSTSFDGGLLQGVVGKGYAGWKDVSVTTLEQFDGFGQSVSLSTNGIRLVVGAPGDDGSGNQTTDAGAAYLFNFTSTSFDGGLLQCVVGKGYAGWKDVSVTTLEQFDGFGQSVALDSNGSRLAVGAPGDDGFGNLTAGAGAAYLFSFTSTSFDGGLLQGVVGKGYAGWKDVSVTTLQQFDGFGQSVSLSTGGSRLAVGAPGDDGFGNQTPDAGVAYLFSFTSTSFDGGLLQCVVGRGYAGAKDIESWGTGVYSPVLEKWDELGLSVSLNSEGNRLAVGSVGDDGWANLGQTFYGQAGHIGAVHLFGFTNTSFEGGSLMGTIGKGYTGGKNIDVTSLENSDAFGYSVSLNATGNRLAVGARGDSGLGNVLTGAGSVYLFGFSDDSFGGGSVLGIIGKGYTGGKNIDVPTLGWADGFGSAVSLNAVGDRLAVGVYLDDGFNNVVQGAGAVYLFGFTDVSFGGGALLATIGRGYVGGKNVDMSFLETDDYFGTSVSLNAVGNRLAVGTRGDDGLGNVVSSAGAVHLFDFTDELFDGGSLLATIGKGYAGGKNFDLALDEFNLFGHAVSLNAAGNKLAVGSPGDWGYGNVTESSGAVFLFGFTDASFGGNSLLGIIGKGYTGAQMIDLPTLDIYDNLGMSVSLNAAGDRLAVGATSDDGLNNLSEQNVGAVYLFRFASSFSAEELRFGSNPGGLTTVSASELVAQLKAGTSLTLQANNDITVSSAINVGAGSTGTLSLLAGRNVRFDADVILGSRNLGVIANASASDGVIGAYRDAGQGGFSMASGVSVQAGTFGMVVRGVDTSISNPNSSPGSVTLGSLSVSSLGVGISGLGLSGRTVSQLAGSSISVSGSVMIANQAGDISLAETGNGAWSGTTSLSASGSLAVRAASALMIDSLSAASFDVRSSSVVTVSGPVSLGASGYGFMSSTSANFSNAITLEASADMRVNASGSITLAGITPSLAAGSLLRFYGCDDVVVSAPIAAASGSVGELRLTAGRDIKLNASVDLGGVDLYARANAKASDGIFGSYRPVGQGDFTMASGTSLEADSVTVIVRGVDTDVTNINSSPGGIVLADVEAGSLTLAIEGSGFTDRAINQYVGYGISVSGNASVSNSLGNTVLSSALNGAWLGTTTLSSSGITSLRVGSALNLGGLSASGFTVVSSGPMSVGGLTSLGMSGSGLLQAPGIDVAGSVSLGMFSTLNAVSSREMRLTGASTSREMRLTGASTSLATGASLRLWSTNLAIDTTNRVGYNYKLYGATYGVSNVTSTGIGWIYSLSSPYALSAPAAMPSSAGMSLQMANYYRPVTPTFLGAYPMVSPAAPRSFESFFNSGELILPILSAPYRWDGVQDEESSSWLLDTKRDSASTTPAPTR